MVEMYLKYRIFISEYVQNCLDTYYPGGKSMNAVKKSFIAICILTVALASWPQNRANMRMADPQRDFKEEYLKDRPESAAGLDSSDVGVWDTSSFVKFVYDNNQHIIKRAEIYIGRASSDTDFGLIDTFFYDGVTGRLSIIEQFTRWYGSVEKLFQHKLVYSGDTISQLFIYSYTNNIISDSTREVFHYTDNLLTLADCQTWNSGTQTWTTEGHIQYVHNAVKRDSIIIYTEGIAGRAAVIDTDFIETYTYDAKGRAYQLLRDFGLSKSLYIYYYKDSPISRPFLKSNKSVFSVSHSIDRASSSPVFHLSLSSAASVTLLLYDLRGALLGKVMENRFFPSGRHTIPSSTIFKSLGAGTYLYRIRAAGEFQNRLFIKDR